MIPESLPGVVRFRMLASKRSLRILYLAVVAGGGGYVIYAIVDSSLLNIALALVIAAAIGGFVYAELCAVTARLQLESDALLYTNLFIEKRIPYSAVKGFVPYFFAGGPQESKGVQLLVEKGKRITVHDQFNDYELLRDWLNSNFVNLKAPPTHGEGG